MFSTDLAPSDRITAFAEIREELQTSHGKIKKIKSIRKGEVGKEIYKVDYSKESAIYIYNWEKYNMMGEQ